MKFCPTIALLAIIVQYAEGHQMLRSTSTNSVNFSALSEAGSDFVGSLKHKPRDGSCGGHVGGRHHGPPRPKGSFDGSFDGYHKWASFVDGSFPGPHGEWPGSFDGSFKGHGKDVPFPRQGKGKKANSSDASGETEQQTTQQ